MNFRGEIQSTFTFTGSLDVFTVGALLAGGGFDFSALLNSVYLGVV